MTAPTRRRYPGAPPPQQFAIELARGLVTGMSGVRKFGHNESVGTSFEDIWDAGGTYPFPTSALAVRVAAGGNAADDSAGAGARTIRVVGLDETWADASEDITLAGASASAATTTTFIRVFRAYVLTAGTYGAPNTGDISIETTGSTELARIPAGLGQTMMAVYTIPAGKVGYLVGIDVASETKKTFSIRLWRREDADTTSAPFSGKRLVSEFHGIADRASRSYRTLPAVFPAMTDIWMAAAVETGTGMVAAEFDVVLVDAA